MKWKGLLFGQTKKQKVMYRTWKCKLKKKKEDTLINLLKKIYNNKMSSNGNDSLTSSSNEISFVSKNYLNDYYVNNFKKELKKVLEEGIYSIEDKIENRFKNKKIF